MVDNQQEHHFVAISKIHNRIKSMDDTSVDHASQYFWSTLILWQTPNA